MMAQTMEEHYAGCCKCREKKTLNFGRKIAFFRNTNIPFLAKYSLGTVLGKNFTISAQLTEMLLLKTKKELQSFLSIMNYLSKFLLATVGVCISL